MSLEWCNGFLEAMALLNDGTNHGSSYIVEPLPEATSLDSSLGKYFLAMSTSRVPPQRAEAWQIRPSIMFDNHPKFLDDVVRRWFFEQEFSPKVEPIIVENVVQEFLARIRNVIGDATIFQVKVSPPMWYECVWEDVAFESKQGRWILHLGFSD